MEFKSKYFLIIGLVVLIACNKTDFLQIAKSDDVAAAGNSTIEEPASPSPLPTPIVTTPSLKLGTCNPGESLNSCLSCPGPQQTNLISTKAQKLAKIMTMSCQIINKSYPKDYVSPSAEQVLSHLSACSPELYPETPMSDPQSAAIDRLLDTSDSSLRQKMFKSLWYQPPYTEYFETYFGLDNSEAANVICMNSGYLPSTLLTKEYMDAMNGDAQAWSANPQAQARWKFAQTLRQQLLSCFNKGSLSSVVPNPIVGQTKCKTRSFEGEFSQGGEAEIRDALGQGYNLSVETNNTCSTVASIPATNSLQGKIKIIGYKCD